MCMFFCTSYAYYVVLSLAVHSYDTTGLITCAHNLNCDYDDFRAIFSLLLDLGSKKTLRSEKNHFCKNFVVFHRANFHRLTR